MFQNCISYFQFIDIGFLTVFRVIIATECNIGFYGLYPICKECPFPSYGVKCQYICDCNNETCDHITGCLDSLPSIDGDVTIHISKESADSEVIQSKTSSGCDIGFYEYLLRCKMCPYPSFGIECQSICDCQNDTCNHKTGCQEQISNEAEITVTVPPTEYLLSSVCSLPEDAALKKTRETISGLTKSIIFVGCIGVCIICLHFILCLGENAYKSSHQLEN